MSGGIRISNLPYGVDNETIRSFLSKVTTDILNVRLGEGFAEVELKDEGDIESLLMLDGQDLHGTSVRVEGISSFSSYQPEMLRGVDKEKEDREKEERRERRRRRKEEKAKEEEMLRERARLEEIAMQEEIKRKEDEKAERRRKRRERKELEKAESMRNIEEVVERAPEPVRSYTGYEELKPQEILTEIIFDPPQKLPERQEIETTVETKHSEKEHKHRDKEHKRRSKEPKYEEKEILYEEKKIIYEEKEHTKLPEKISQELPKQTSPGFMDIFSDSNTNTPVDLENRHQLKEFLQGISLSPRKKLGHDDYFSVLMNYKFTAIAVLVTILALSISEIVG